MDNFEWWRFFLLRSEQWCRNCGYICTRFKGSAGKRLPLEFWKLWGFFFNVNFLCHCSSEEHLCRLHLIPENRCPHGDGDGSVYHKIFLCNQFKRGRAKLVAEVQRKIHRLPSSMADLIQDLRLDIGLDIYRQLFNYLKEHQLFL